ncbi:hypothetical protein [Phytoactinopolyspora limicola]|uniref:hypothetical protein n=1 Tax=Phytoactinopolyspora limicola TaxID=2715536 RepID=UPI00140B97BF|nr:hypothetical protein [Phytoactinopolyspora limicola]
MLLKVGGIVLCVFTVLLLNPGCSAERKLDDATTCRELATGLAEANIGWPVAQNFSRVSAESMAEVLTIFESATDVATPPLKTDLADWATTFKKAIPYLVSRDEVEFINSISESEQQRFFDANVSITQTCGW